MPERAATALIRKFEGSLRLTAEVKTALNALPQYQSRLAGRPRARGHRRHVSDESSRRTRLPEASNSFAFFYPVYELVVGLTTFVGFVYL